MSGLPEAPGDGHLLQFVALEALPRGALARQLDTPLLQLRTPAKRSHFIRNLIGPERKTTLVLMTTGSISELKANLSRFLREVCRGGEVQVLDRGKPVARLVPPDVGDDQGARQALVRLGRLRPGKAGAAAVLEKPPLKLPVSLLEALDEERNDRL